MGQQSRFADTRLTGKQVDTTTGDSGTKNAVKLANSSREGVTFLGSESVFDRERLDGFGGDFFGTAPWGL